ncbi:MAG: hypothetical protein AAF902_26830, partial [Chloroflexota bacterium]
NFKLFRFWGETTSRDPASGIYREGKWLALQRFHIVRGYPCRFIPPRRRGKTYRDLLGVGNPAEVAFERIFYSEWHHAILEVLNAYGPTPMFELPGLVIKAMGFGHLGRVKQGIIFKFCIQLHAWKLLTVTGIDSYTLNENPPETQKIWNIRPPFPESDRLYEAFMSRPTRTEMQAGENLDLPIVAKNYSLALDGIDTRFWPRDLLFWLTNHKSYSPKNWSTYLYRFDPEAEKFVWTIGKNSGGDKFRQYADFPADISSFKLLGIYNRLHYNALDAQFTSNDVFGLHVDLPSIPAGTVLRVYRNPNDGLFYGLASKRSKPDIRNFKASDLTLNRYDLCLGDLTNEMVSPIKVDRVKLNTKSQPKLCQVDKQIQKDVLNKEIFNLMDIVGYEAPIHIKEVERRFADVFHKKAATQAQKTMLKRVISEAEAAGKIVRKGEFLHRPHSKKPIQPRSRATLKAASRKMDYIAEEEILAGIRALHDAGFELNKGNAHIALAQFFGVVKPNGEAAKRLVRIFENAEK